MFSLLSDDETSWGPVEMPGRATEEVPWTGETTRGAVFVLQSDTDQQFRAYLLRDDKTVMKVEGALSAYDDFADTVNLWWANSGARGAFLWQTQLLGGSLPDDPPDPPDPLTATGEATISVLAVESNAATTQQIFLDTLGVVCGSGTTVIA